MVGKTSANTQKTSAAKRGARSGFSLVELLISIVIVVILIGVTTTLMHGSFSMLTASAEVSSAKRNAQDVFNILAVPMRNAALGIPTENMGFYMSAGEGSPLETWNTPIEVVEGDDRFKGNALKIVYSVPSGVKNGRTAIGDFKSTGLKEAGDVNPTDPLTATGELPEGGPLGIHPASADTRAFITFPGMNMHPVFVGEIVETDKKQAELYGKRRQGAASGDVLRDIVNPYQDINLVRAGLACVVEEGGTSVFCLFEVATDDPSDPGNLEDMEDVESRAGFRVEGIKAVSFDLDPERRYITAWVLAEEKVGASLRKRSLALTEEVKGRWGPLIGTNVFNEELYYEDFSMTWRIRNFQKN